MWWRVSWWWHIPIWKVEFVSYSLGCIQVHFDSITMPRIGGYCTVKPVEILFLTWKSVFVVAATSNDDLFDRASRRCSHYNCHSHHHFLKTATLSLKYPQNLTFSANNPTQILLLTMAVVFAGCTSNRHLNDYRFDAWRLKSFTSGISIYFGKHVDFSVSTHLWTQLKFGVTAVAAYCWQKKY